MAEVPAKTQTLQSPWQTACGPLEEFLLDPSVTEIMVNGHQRIFVEQKGILKKTQSRFATEEELLSLMKNIASAVGKTLNEETPYIDARLPDGSRVNCIIAPVAVDGPALTIRKFSKETLTHQDLINGDFMDERLAYFLSSCVLAKMNIIVAGGTGSGKTTLLNVLSSFIPSVERLVTIEDTAELRLRNENLVRMESHPPTVNDKGISMQNLVINALRMRPDRIIIGECRGPEAFDMLTAMNTGHEGSMTSVHANSARDALRRLEVMILMANIDIPINVVRQNISSALNLIVFVQRGTDGVRRLKEVIEIGGMEGDVILSQDVFLFQDNAFKTTGLVPQFVRHFKDRGVVFPMDFFTDTYVVKSSQSHKKR